MNQLSYLEKLAVSSKLPISLPISEGMEKEALARGATWLGSKLLGYGASRAAAPATRAITNRAVQNAVTRTATRTGANAARHAAPVVARGAAQGAGAAGRGGVIGAMGRHPWLTAGAGVGIGAMMANDPNNPGAVPLGPDGQPVDPNAPGEAEAPANFPRNDDGSINYDKMVNDAQSQQPTQQVLDPYQDVDRGDRKRFKRWRKQQRRDRRGVHNNAAPAATTPVIAPTTAATPAPVQLNSPTIVDQSGNVISATAGSDGIAANADFQRRLDAANLESYKATQSQNALSRDYNANPNFFDNRQPNYQGAGQMIPGALGSDVGGSLARRIPGGKTGWHNPSGAPMTKTRAGSPTGGWLARMLPGGKPGYAPAY